MPSRPKSLRLVVRNNGPSDVADAFVELIVGSEISGQLAATADPNCNVSPNPPANAARWTIGPMVVGSTIECTLSLSPSGGTLPRGGLLAARVRATGNIDPVASNNIGTSYEAYVSPVDYIRDMALSIRSPAGILRPGIAYNVDFTLTNLGPGLEGNPNFTQDIYSQTYLVGPGSGEFFAFAYDGDPDCRYLVEDVGSGTFARTSIITFGPLAPGQSRTCTLLLAVLPGATGTRRLPFWNYAELPGVFDERLENNIADLTLQYSAPAIPAGSPWAWLVLALALGSVGLVQARRQVAARP